MDAADQICELPEMMRDVGPTSLSSNPCLRGATLPIEDPSGETVTLRRDNGVKNSSEIPGQLRRGSGDVELRRGSGDKDKTELPFLLRRGSGDKDNGEPPVQMRRGRRGSADIDLQDSRRASWGYCGSHLLKARPLDRNSKIEIKKKVIPENVENIDEAENDGSSQSLVKNIENKDDSIKNGSPSSISSSIENKGEKSTQTGNSVIEKMKRQSLIEN